MLAALRRSVQLTSGRRWQISRGYDALHGHRVCGSNCFLGSVLVAMMLSARAGQQPEWLVFASSVFGAIGGSVAGSLVMIVLVLCYYDRHMPQGSFRSAIYDLQLSIGRPRNKIQERHLLPEAPLFLRTIARIVGPYSHLIFLASLWTCPANAQAPSRSLSLQQYIAQLHAASDILNNASAAAGTASVHDFRPGPPHQVDSGFRSTIRAGKNGLVGERSGNRRKPLLPDAADRLMPARERLAALMDAGDRSRRPRRARAQPRSSPGRASTAF